MCAILNSILALMEDWWFGQAILAVQLHPEPVFILGHPRSGTTLLHQLLAEDPRFCYVTTYQAGFPSAFLLTQRFNRALSWLIDDTRPMDALPLSFSTPAEDEIASNLLTGGISPYLCTSFMTHYHDLLRYATFEEVPARDTAAWTGCFLYFLKKVTYAAGGPKPKPLVIKSPVHMGRLPILQRLFPRAKFIFIHRSPMEVFQSSVHLAPKYFTYCYLDRPSNADITNYILMQRRMLYEVYLRHRDNLPPDSLAELSFEELEANPSAALRKVYQRLQWLNFENYMAKRAEKYVDVQLAGFKKNCHSPLPPSLLARLEMELAPISQGFRYH